MDTWHDYLLNCYPREIFYSASNVTFVRLFHPILDSSITTEEIFRSVRCAKSGKTPGSDGIPNDFFKHLPQKGIEFDSGVPIWI